MKIDRLHDLVSNKTIIRMEFDDVDFQEDAVVRFLDKCQQAWDELQEEYADD